jgi:hypothetical protein
MAVVLPDAGKIKQLEEVTANQICLKRLTEI